MMSPQNSGRRHATPVDGMLLLNKPAGITSNQALQKVKRLLHAKKAGHTGSLDPAATGMLPLCFGEATKVCAYLLAADKTYRVTAKLGEATDTGDADGEIVETRDIPDMNEQAWTRLLNSFIGDIEQIPPMYSALKKDGKRLYELARNGQVVEREARPVRIDEIELLEAHGSRLAMRVRCSKGTYIRTLVEDIARAAGTVAHTSHLHRETVGDFRAEDMLDMPTAERFAESGPEPLRERLMAPDMALSGWLDQKIPAELQEQFTGGQSVPVGDTQVGSPGELVRVYSEHDRFLGVGEVAAGGQLAPRRIFRITG